MISVCARLYSLTGDVVIHHPETMALDDVSRRLSRQPTLDGGAYIYDGGFSQADRSMSFEVGPAEATEDLKDRLSDLVRYSANVTIAVDEGVFLGVVQSLSHRAGRLTVSLWIQEKVSA